MSTEPQNKLARVYTEEDATAIGLPTAASLSLLKNFANEMVGTPFMPTGLGDHPGTLMAVMLRGREMGLKPMESLDAFWLSPQKRLAMYSNWMLVVLRRAKISITFKQCDNQGCVMVGVRPDGDTYEASWTVEDTKRAGIGGVHPKYPRAMNRARATGDLFRALASDYGGGNMYTQEEIQDMEAESGDQKRADQIVHGGNEEFVVGRKEAPKPEPAPVTVDVKAEPAPPTAETKPPVAETKADPVTTEAPKPETVKEPGTPIQSVPQSAPAEKTPAEIRAERYNAKMDGITDLLPNSNPTKVKAMAKAFMLGYFGVATMKSIKVDDALELGFPAMEHSIRSNADAFMSDPSGAGRISKHSSGTLKEALGQLGWSDATIGLANDVTVKWAQTPDAFLRSYCKAVGLNLLQDADANAYLRVALVTREACCLTEIKEEFGVPVVEIVAQIEMNLHKPIEQIDENTLANTIKLGQKALRMDKEKQSGDAQEPEDDELPFGE